MALLHPSRLAPLLPLLLAAHGTAPEPYAIILIPDTQNYTGEQSGGGPPIDQPYRVEMQWIADHQKDKNIVAAIHLGDITNSNDQTGNLFQWNIASQAHDILDASGIPYSVIPGNHDHNEVVKDEVLSRRLSGYRSKFGVSRFSDRPWFLPTHPFDDPDNANNAIRFEVGEWKYLGVNLDFAPTKNAVCWAGELIESLKDHRVIVSTHSYLSQGKLLDAQGHRELNYTANRSGYNMIGMGGRDLWNELISRHSNIEMVVSGHVSGGATYVPVPSPVRDSVHQILVDHQEEYRFHNEHGNGWLKVLEIRPSSGKVNAYPVSALNLDKFNAPSESDSCDEPSEICYSTDPGHWDHTFNFTLEPFPRDQHLPADSFAAQIVNLDSGGNQRWPSVAVGPSGEFMVVWEDDSEAPSDTFDIFGRRFAHDGCGEHAQFRVNVFSKRQQLHPDVDLDDDGNAVIVWADDSHGAAGVYQIYARGLGVTGAERFRRTVNSNATGSQTIPRVAVAKDGAFAVAWLDGRSAPSKVYLRGFDREGNPGPLTERRVHPGSSGAEDAPDIAVRENGDAIVVWEAGGDAFAAGFTPAGAVRFTPVRLGAAAGAAGALPGWQGRPSVAAVPSGFVAVWEECVGPANYTSATTGCVNNRPRRVRAMVHGTNGAPLPGGATISAALAAAARPRIAADARGRSVVAWQDKDPNGVKYDIKFQTLDAGASPLGEAVILNKFTRDEQIHPAVSARRTPGGKSKWVVTWEDDVDDNDVTEVVAQGGEF